MSSDNILFKKEDIKTYDIKSLHGKVLTMKVLEGDGVTMLFGEDSDGQIYVIQEQYK